ncbi:MAG: hypothetical protein HN467_07275 [Opitutae bacterium]|nr:hypothetical protein [Opitutae bacterium]
MKKILLISLTSIALIFATSCSSDADAAICGNCGDEKGTENCCKADAEKCEKCDKNKGSPGCCKE